MSRLFTDEILDHIKRNQGMFQPFVLKMRGVGFSCRLAMGEDEQSMDGYADTGILPELYEIAARHAGPGEGRLRVYLHDRLLVNTVYDQNGHSEIDLAFLRGKAREFLKQMPAIINQIRDALLTHFDNQTIFDLIDFGADHLTRTENPFSYSIDAFGSAIFDGKMDGTTLRVNILDPPAYVRLGLFLLKGADALALSFRSPFDILALFDTLQASLRHLALAYEERGMMIEVSALGHRLMTCGAGVRSNLMTSRFGPTAIHLDKVLKIMSSALASFT